MAELRGENDEVLAELAEKTGKKVSEAPDEVADDGESLLGDLRDTERELQRKAIYSEYAVVDATRDGGNCVDRSDVPVPGAGGRPSRPPGRQPAVR